MFVLSSGVVANKGLLAALCLVAACKTNNVSQVNNISVQTIGPSGGELVGPGGARIAFPAGAVPQPTDFTIRVVSAYPDLGGRALASSVYSFEPHGFIFSGAVTVTLPLAFAGTSAQVLHAACSPSGDCQPWDTSVAGAQFQNGMAIFTTPALSLYAVAAAGGTGVTDPSCPFGQRPNAAGMCLPTGGGGDTDAGTLDPPTGDGTVVRTGLPSDLDAFAVDDGFVYFVTSTTDAFGVTERSIQAARLGEDSPPQTVARFTGGSQPFIPLGAAGGYAYWTQSSPDPATGSGELWRARPGSAAELVSQTTKAGLAIVNGSVLFRDASGQLRRYDPVSSTLDPIVYSPGSDLGAPAPGAFTASDGPYLFWLTGGSGGAPFQLWMAERGRAGAATGVTLPAGAQISSFGATARTVIVTTSTPQATSVVALDTTLGASASPQIIATVRTGPGGGGSGLAQLPYVGDGLYVASWDGAELGSIERVSLPDGQQTTIGTYAFDGRQRPIVATTEGVYTIESNGNDTRLLRWDLAP